MKRFLIGALAVIGVLSLLLFVAGVGLTLLAAGSKPTVPASVVLELDLSEPLPEYVLDDSLAGAFGNKEATMRDVLDALHKAGEDARVKGLVVRVGARPGSMAQLQELRDAVKAFRAKGKKAVAYTDTFGEMGGATSAYYLAAAFDEIYMQPSGDLNLTGVAAETPFARDAFAKLGVAPRIGKRHEYKNAVNTYTEAGYTAPHREATEKFLGSLFGQVVRGIQEDRQFASEDEVRALIDRAPYFGQEAVDAKLVDGLLYRDEVYEKLKAHAGGEVKFLWVDKYLERAGRPHVKGDTVALVYGVGGVTRGKSQSNPLSGEQTMGGDSVAAALRKAIEDKNVKAIVFRVDSPGGSYVASDTVRREVQHARAAGKPVIVTMGTYAASGGYFVSMDADRVVAQPGTLTGSIGVFGGKMVTAEFWSKVGVNWDTIAFGKNATLYSTDQEWTAEQQAKNDAELDRIYADFTRRAADGRKLPLEKLHALAKGRVWTGEDALAHGLVDALGGFAKALELAREAAQLPKDAPLHVQVFPREKKGAEVLAQLLRGGGGGDNSEDDATTSVGLGLAPVLEQTRAMYRLGVQMGVLRRTDGALAAELPPTQW